MCVTQCKGGPHIASLITSNCYYPPLITLQVQYAYVGAILGGMIGTHTPRRLAEIDLGALQIGLLEKWVDRNSDWELSSYSKQSAAFFPV